MLNWLKNFGKIERSRRLSIIFGSMIIVGIIFVIVGAMASIKVTPYRIYKNTKSGVLIKFPAYWTPIFDPAPGSLVAFVAPKDNELDTVQENFNIAIKVVSREMTIEYLSKMIIKQVTGTFGDMAEITQSIPTTMGGKAGYRFTFAGYGEKIPNPYQYVVTWTIVGERVYILTFVGLQKDYPLYEKKVNAMFRSFKFIPVETQ